MTTTPEQPARAVATVSDEAFQKAWAVWWRDSANDGVEAMRAALDAGLAVTLRERDEARAAFKAMEEWHDVAVKQRDEAQASADYHRREGNRMVDEHRAERDRLAARVSELETEAQRERDDHSRTFARSRDAHNAQAARIAELTELLREVSSYGIDGPSDLYDRMSRALSPEPLGNALGGDGVKPPEPLRKMRELVEELDALTGPPYGSGVHEDWIDGVVERCHAIKHEACTMTSREWPNQDPPNDGSSLPPNLRKLGELMRAAGVHFVPDKPTPRAPREAQAGERPVRIGDAIEILVHDTWIDAAVTDPDRAFGDRSNGGFYACSRNGTVYHLSKTADERSKAWRFTSIPAPQPAPAALDRPRALAMCATQGCGSPANGRDREFCIAHQPMRVISRSVRPPITFDDEDIEPAASAEQPGNTPANHAPPREIPLPFGAFHTTGGWGFLRRDGGGVSVFSRWGCEHIMDGDTWKSVVRVMAASAEQPGAVTLEPIPPGPMYTLTQEQYAQLMRNAGLRPAAPDPVGDRLTAGMLRDLADTWDAWTKRDDGSVLTYTEHLRDVAERRERDGKGRTDGK